MTKPRRRRAFARTVYGTAYGAALGVLAALAGVPDGAAAQAPDHQAVMERALESRTKGDGDVVVFEIADFQCPYCARFALTVAPALDELYVRAGKVQWVFVNMPLHTHRLAWLAAEAALCAGVAGGKFWAMSDRLFHEQQAWTRAPTPSERFAEYARAADVRMDEYRACVADDWVAPLILQDVASAVSARVDGTPTFIVMRGDQVLHRMVGVHTVEEWRRVLDEALSGQ